MQALFLQALDPVAETTADRNSYGFRKERSCADAINQCWQVLAKPGSAQWVLEGDIKACFDRIGHDWLLSHTPLEKEIVRKWLKSGYVEKSVFYQTEEAGECEAEGRTLGRKAVLSLRYWRTWPWTDWSGCCEINTHTAMPPIKGIRFTLYDMRTTS